MIWKQKMHKINTISKILKLKDNKKQEIEIEVKRAAEQLDEERSKLINLEKDYQEKLTCFNDKNAEGCLDVSKVNSYYDYFARIDGKINAQREIHNTRKNELKAIKDVLINAHQDKKMFEILKEKAVKKDKKEKEISAQKEADFFVLARKLK